ncbi:MAG: hypothetical protein KF745_07170 [Phycisphaeraceae bacterium]|nr:hypothetical protein [Phycisphaeraceae bacterium]
MSTPQEEAAMGTESSLAQRIKAEFDQSAQRAKAGEQARQQEREAREKRLAQFNSICDDLAGIWRPRIQEFLKQFGDKVKATPTMSPSLREGKVTFLTDMANMTVTISASASPDVTKLVLDYDLLITPIFFDYERHTRLEMPLDKIDRNAVGKWIDDQLVSCVKAYLTMQENQYYIQRAMVEDPVTRTRFLPQNAVAKIEHAGHTHYFDSDKSLQQYKTMHQIA